MDSDYALMKSCCECLETIHGVNYRITDGTVLGLYRDGGFIKHDDDFDIDILFANIDQIELIKSKFKNLGFTLGREVYYKSQVQQIVFYLDNGFIFDINFWHKIDSQIFNYSERGYERVQEFKYFDKNNIECIKFKDKSYPIPTPIEEWLRFRFGDDWKVPKTYKGDWKETCLDLIKM